MSNTRNKQRTSFLWQGLLILLPVAVLAAVGLFSLRQDRLLAEQEARERAQRLADDLVEQVWAVLVEPGTSTSAPEQGAHGTDSNEVVFRVTSAGALVFPKPPAPLMPQPLDTSMLTVEQARLWQTARNSEFGASETNAALKAYQEFLETRPPESLAAIAEFSRGLLFLKSAEADAAVRQFESTIAGHPDALLESGLPLATLARLKVLESAHDKAAQAADERIRISESWYSNAVLQPTPVTAQLLKQFAARNSATPDEEAVASRWQRIWASHERAWNLYADAASRWLGDSATGTITGILTDPQFATLNNASVAIGRAHEIPQLSWLHDGTDWLAIAKTATNSEQSIHCLPELQVRELVNGAIAQSGGIPGYFGVGVDVAGRSLSAPTNLAVWFEGRSGKGGGPGKTYAATFGNAEHEGIAPPMLANSRKTEQGVDLLRLNIYLTSPATLFARQRDRTLWFALLIVVSAATAVTGLVVAWRAFDRQQRLNEMKSNFVSSVSHELRAPIASVRLMAESLDRGKVPDSQKQAGYFKLIVQECRRLTSLIENVLDFSRLEQGGRRYEFEPTDLAILIQQTLTLMEPYAAARHVSLKCESINAPLIVEADGKAIQQALINLLDNAIKHSPEGATVECGLAPLPKDEPRSVRISIRDQGEGIPPEERTRIFEPFYRCGSELRRETQGVGIGLTIVKHIVEAHGGRVDLQSEPGKGSCFSIHLPLNQSTEEQGLPRT